MNPLADYQLTTVEIYTLPHFALFCHSVIINVNDTYRCEVRKNRQNTANYGIGDRKNL